MSIRVKSLSSKEAKVVRKPTTHYCLCLDNSGSMNSIRQQVISAVNERINHVKELAKDQNVDFTLINFANKAECVYHGCDINDLKPLTIYNPNGWTALLDGVGLGIGRLKNTSRYEEDINNVSFLMEVITDGEENVSSQWNDKSLLAEMTKLAKTGIWTFAFQVPFGYKAALVNKFNIPSDCVFEWENTIKGTERATQATLRGFNNYFASRSTGVKKLDTFYAPVDLSSVKPTELKKLQDLSNQFKIFECTKEESIKEFTEKCTKKPYVIGQSKFEVVKAEKGITPTKEVYVMERGKDKIYGGDEARNLIGLPTNANANIDPVNLSNYRVFIESRSVNRKLPRGSKLLVEINATKDKVPTWGADD